MLYIVYFVCVSYVIVRNLLGYESRRGELNFNFKVFRRFLSEHHCFFGFSCAILIFFFNVFIFEDKIRNELRTLAANKDKKVSIRLSWN